MTMDGYEAGCDMTREQYAAHMENEVQQHEAMMEEQAIAQGVEVQIAQHQHLVHLLKNCAALARTAIDHKRYAGMDDAAAAARAFADEFYGNEDDTTFEGTPF